MNPSVKFEGVLLIDKPTGMTSHDVVARVRRLLNEKRVGHAGTLDPLATGVLVILVGSATRLSDYLLNESKTYEVAVELGRETDTLDVDGRTVAAHQGPLPGAEEIVETVISTRGRLELPVPSYSAVKVGGKKLYEYARKGETVETIHREMIFDRVDFVSFEGAVLQARLTCSKGSFVRSWAAEIGRRLGVGGTVQALRRTASGTFQEASLITMDTLVELTQNGADPGNLLAAIAVAPIPGVLPLGEVLQSSVRIEVDQGGVGDMVRGKIPGEILRLNQRGDLGTPLVRVVDSKGALLAVLERGPTGALSIGCVLARADH